MRVIIGSDHAGFDGRLAAVQYMTSRGIEVQDLGPETKESVDYPDYAHQVANAITEGTADLGVLICGTGQGMAMAANRHSGVRAAVITNELTAQAARSHNNANIACFGERVVGVETIPKLLALFLDTEFEGDRHARRVDKIEA